MNEFFIQANGFPCRPVKVPVESAAPVIRQETSRSDSSSSASINDSQALPCNNHGSQGFQSSQERNGSRQHTPGSDSPQGQEILHTQTEVGSVCLIFIL